MPREGSRGWAAATIGFILALSGLGVIIYEMFTVSPTSLPLNNVTFAGAAIAAAGFAVFAIGFERGRPTSEK
jgi:hypothetical protein